MSPSELQRVKFQDRFNVLQGFDFSVLNDPNFKEDSVREEIILPILRGLGYSANKPYRMIRSKKLVHPFVSIGSARKKIHLVPDYLLEVNDKYAWLLEAKAPDQPVVSSHHVEQAYSYAINSEIRVAYFALCNGREFALYNISQPDPVLHVDIREIPACWGELTKMLSPETVLSYEYRLAKDFGLHLKRLGFDTFESLVFPNVPIPQIAKFSDDHYTTASGINLGEDGQYCVSFDFNHQVMEQLKGKIPDEAYEILMKPIVDTIQQVRFSDRVFFVNIDCKVGSNLEENDSEIFLPLWINKIL
jgi:hypothetical protein